MRIIFMEIVFYFAMLAICVCTAYLFTQPKPARDLTQIHSDFWNISANSPSTSSELWAWFQNDMVPKLYSTNSTVAPSVVSLGGAVTVSFDTTNFSAALTVPTVHATDMILIGAVRLHQLRVSSSSSCSSNFIYSTISTVCVGDFQAGSNEDQTAFYTSTAPSYLRPAFTWSDSIPGSPFHSNKTYLTYPASGFSQLLPANLAQSSALLSDLESNSWIDPYTAAILVEVNTFHPSTEAFVTDTLIFEFSNSGALDAGLSTTVVFSETVVAGISSKRALSALNVLGIIFLVFASLWYARLLLSVNKRRLFGFLWTYVDLTLLALMYVYLGIRVNLFSTMSKIVSPTSTFPDPTQFYSLSLLFPGHSSCVSTQTAILLLMFFRGFKLSYIFARRILKIFSTSFVNFFSTTIIIGLTLIGFAFAFQVARGDYHSEFSSLSDSFAAVSLSLVGVLWYVDATTNFGRFITLWFVALVYLVLIPLLVVFGIEAWSEQVLRTEGGSGSRNPLLVFIDSYWTGAKKDDQVESLEDGLKIDSMPVVVRQRTIRRRKRVRARVERTFGFSPNEYDVYNDWLSKAEIQRLLDEDQFAVKVLGSDDADAVIERFRPRDTSGTAVEELEESLISKLERLQKLDLDIHAHMNPKIEPMSKELDAVIREVQGSIGTQLSVLKETILAVINTASDLSKKHKGDRYY